MRITAYGSVRYMFRKYFLYIAKYVSSPDGFVPTIFCSNAPKEETVLVRKKKEEGLEY